MASEPALRRAKARQRALTDLARKYRSDYQRFYRSHLKKLGATPEVPKPATTAEPDICAHPRDSWKVFGYGTFCGICNARMR